MSATIMPDVAERVVSTGSTTPTAHAANPNTLLATAKQSIAMAWRGLVKIRRTPEQLFDVTLQPIIFTLMFTYLFGGAIAGSVADYLPTIIPGILVQTVITASVVTGVQLREDMDKGVFDRFRSLPIARIAPLAGALLADSVRYLIASTLTIVMGLILGWRPTGGPLAIVAAGLLVMFVAWAVSWIWAFIGMKARTASSVQGLSMMIMFPLTFLSNAFVPAETLPQFLRAFVNVNPVSHLVTAVRSLVAGGSGGTEVLVALAGAAAVVAIFAPLAVRAYMRKA